MKAPEKIKNTNAKNPFKEEWNGLPAFINGDLREDSINRYIFLSLTTHAIAGGVIWLITAAVLFFGLAPKLFDKPKVENIVFSLHKAEKAQTPKSLAPAANQPAVQSVNEPLPAPKTSAKANKTAEIPDFDIPLPQLKSSSPGKGKTRYQAEGIEASNTSLAGLEEGSKTSSPASSAVGAAKGTAQKISTPYDISPYINELKRNVRWNWKLPQGHVDKRVELFLRIARDGKLVILNVKTTAENAALDNAALEAVRKTTPLRPLPDKYTKGYLDVILIFDAGTNSLTSRR